MPRILQPKSIEDLNRTLSASSQRRKQAAGGGFDLLRLFVGSRGSLGVIVEATFKLAPVPEVSLWLRVEARTSAEIAALAQRVLASGLCPTVLDGHNLDAAGQSSEQLRLIVGFAGSNTEVAWQAERLAAQFDCKKTSSRYHERFWKHAGIDRRSVLPAKLGKALATLSGRPWLARMGNGVIYIADSDRETARRPSRLERRLKATFDPADILPPIPGY